MAGLVEKVKQSIRNRSRHRKSGSGSDFGVVDGDNRASYDEPRHSNQFQDGRRSGQFQDERVGRSTQATPAYHASSTSGGQLNKALPDPAANGHSTIDYNNNSNNNTLATGRDSMSRKPVSNTMGEATPVRSSSLRHGRQSSDVHRDAYTGTTTAEPVPAIPSSHVASDAYAQTPTSTSQGLQQDRNMERNLNERMDGMSLGSGPGRTQQSTGSVGVSDSIRQRNGNTRDEVPPVPQVGSNHRTNVDTVASQSTAESTNPIHEHMRLPDGFNVGHSERTEVTTRWNPAVTRETVFRERTEILQEAITRDIHVHHYYTYLQPVRVVEVLPAKHYLLDYETGRKTEIPTPAGWMLPDDMQSRQPDTGVVKGWSRHYLVDEEHPTGVPEAPPLRHKGGREHVHSEQSVGGHNQGQSYQTSAQPTGRHVQEREYYHDAQPTGRAI